MFGGGPKCARCDKTVYFSEKVRALEKDWHKFCFKCTECDKLLEMGKNSEHDKNPYCTACYQRLYGPKGYGYGVGAGTLYDTGISRETLKKEKAKAEDSE